MDKQDSVTIHSWSRFIRYLRKNTGVCGFEDNVEYHMDLFKNEKNLRTCDCKCIHPHFVGSPDSDSDSDSD